MALRISPDDEFVHLHVHSEYSLLDGSIRIKKLVKELLLRGSTAVALTDHDSMHGALEFWLACKDAKINGIVGYEANIEFWSPGLVPCQASLASARAMEGHQRPAQTGHLVLLAENEVGFANLVSLCTYANTKGKNKPHSDALAIPWDYLKDKTAGLICLTGCLKAELATLLSRGLADQAKNFLDHLKSSFGEGNLFVELINNGLAEQTKLLPELVTLAQRANVPIVASGDVHYLNTKDRETHLSLLAIKHKLQKSDVRNFPSGVHFHLRTNAEMAELWKDLPEAYWNTKKIADRCHLNIDTKSIFMPDYRQREDETSADCIVRLSKQGLLDRRPAIEKALGERFSDQLWQEYENRLDYELSVINKMKFAGYFLIVQDFINWAKNQGIPVGPGRGSAAGSLVTYALKITNIDPIRFNLLFERFLNPERISMPDIDTDFCQDRRGEVLDYVYERYGRRNVSQIVTFGRMMAKNALKNLARISGWAFHDANEFAKLIPEKPGTTLAEAIESEEKIKLRLHADERAQELWNGAVEIEGILASLGIHAAGVIISDRPLDERCPLLESEGQILTQFEHKYAEKIGLIKFDFLGLKTLTVIDKAVKLVNLSRVEPLNIEDIELEDPEVYESISTAHVTGVFQLESAGMRKLIADLRPTCFNDIIAVLALFRPGPLGSGMVEDFVLRKHGKNPVEYLFSELEPILQDTYGVIVYQEQVQKIAAVLANYTLGEADLLRRAMGKKDKNEMERQKARFVSGAAQNGHCEQKAAELFDLMAKFAEYGFNKSHTAAYGWVTYQTAFLKHYYPTEFMAAIMSCDLDNTDKIVTYVRDCRRMNITILPPCVNAATFEFTIPAPRTIRFGLGAVKGLGKGIIELIANERNSGGPFETVPQFIARMDPRKLNRKVMESLVKAGAFDSIASNRAEILENVDAWLRVIAKNTEQFELTSGGLFGFDVPTPNAAKKGNKTHAGSEISSTGVDVVTPAAVTSQCVSSRKTYQPYAVPTVLIPDSGVNGHLLVGVQLKKTRAWSLWQCAEFEKNTLGFYMSVHPADLFQNDLSEIVSAPISDAPLYVESLDSAAFRRKRRVMRFAGIVTMVLEKKKLQDGAKFAVYKLDDGVGEMEVTLYSEQFAALEHKFQLGDCIWADCEVKAGIEEGTVRAVAKAMGLVSELRLELARRISVCLDFDSLKQHSRLLEGLLECVNRFPGRVPLQIEVANERLGLACVAMLANHSVAPCDNFIKEAENCCPGLLTIKRSYRASPARESARPG